MRIVVLPASLSLKTMKRTPNNVPMTTLVIGTAITTAAMRMFHKVGRVIPSDCIIVAVRAGQMKRRMMK